MGRKIVFEFHTASGCKKSRSAQFHKNLYKTVYFLLNIVVGY